MLDYDGHRSIATKETKRTKSETVKVPVLGSVSCGVPKFAEENIEEYVRLPVALFGRGEFFILRANGDSMIEANIQKSRLCRAGMVHHQIQAAGAATQKEVITYAKKAQNPLQIPRMSRLV